MSELVNVAIEMVLDTNCAYCKFLSANDSGETGGHQSGILISKSAKNMLFSDEELHNNHILKHISSIKWQNDFVTSCTFTWYESKNELRITGFGRGFSLLNQECTGDLFVLIKHSNDEFSGYIFSTDDDIRLFLDSFGLTPAETNRPIETKVVNTGIKEKCAIDLFIEGLGRVDFPSSSEMSVAARRIELEVYMNETLTTSDPDAILLRWIEREYKIFKALEEVRYGRIISQGFQSIDDFISLSNQVLNRRKSRAGKSLENHLAAIFDANNILYTSQARTEGNKKPDFLFPSEEAYHDLNFSVNNLCFLAAKTTCKDRWRQILNEADRLRDGNKYLCTLQQGISASQINEMEAEKVVLVVPKPYISAYPKEKREHIWTLERFVSYVKELEGIY